MHYEDSRKQISASACPISKGGKNVKSNIVICHWETNEEKGDFFPHWQANGHRFHARRTNGESNRYSIVKER